MQSSWNSLFGFPYYSENFIVRFRKKFQFRIVIHETVSSNNANKWRNRRVFARDICAAVERPPLMPTGRSLMKKVREGCTDTKKSVLCSQSTTVCPRYSVLYSSSTTHRSCFFNFFRKWRTEGFSCRTAAAAAAVLDERLRFSQLLY